MPKIVLISGSPSSSSRSGAILDYIQNQLRIANLETDLFALRDFPAEDLILGKYESPAFQIIKAKIEASVGLVIITPVYKAAYTGGLKALLDILPQAAFKGKTILPLATGGSTAHLLVIDYAFKPVLSALGATNLHQGVYVVDKELALSPEGKLSLPPELRERIDNAIKQFIADTAR